MIKPCSNCSPLMSAKMYHVGMHLFTNYMSNKNIRKAARKIKEIVLEDPDAPTCYEGDLARAKLTIQTEFIPSEFTSNSDPLSLLGERLDILFDEGFAVHLLLPIHQMPSNDWQGVNWQNLSNWSNHSTFVPYQPWVDEFDGQGVQCPYDVLFDNFHKPIIDFLVETERAEKLSVIYLMNEFGYMPDVVNDNASDWGGASNWMEVRAEALHNTAKRALDKALNAANGIVPVGLKFAQVESSNTGWTPASSGYPDTLEEILTYMSNKSCIFGYDVYFNDSDPYDSVNRDRLAPFLPMFSGTKLGLFEISESGRECVGAPGEFDEGSRTTPNDIIGTMEFWPEARGYNLFAYNASGSYGGCYALADSMGNLFSGADDEARALWGLMRNLISE